jgi:SAM-dependent methyltransferase
LDGVVLVADLGCGAGADTIALAQAGLTVNAVDLDPDAIVAARHNASVAGVGDRVTFSLEDALTTDLTGVDVVMVDPARRDAAGRRLLNPGQWSPTYEQVLAISRRVPSLVAKLGPGVDHSLLPYASDTEWVQDGDDLVEAALWTGHLSKREGRSAVLLRDGSEFVITEADMPPWAPKVAGVGKFVYEPQPAVIRSGLVGVTLAAVDGWLVDRAIAYVMADELVPTPTATAYRVIAEVPFAVKRLRAELQERGYGNVIVKKRGVSTDPEELRKSLRLSGDAGTAIVMLTRTAAGPLALLVEPA